MSLPLYFFILLLNEMTCSSVIREKIVEAHCCSPSVDIDFWVQISKERQILK